MSKHSMGHRQKADRVKRSVTGNHISKGRPSDLVTRTSKDIAKLEQHIQVLTSDLQRVQADFVNYRRRTEEERQKLMEFTKQSVVAQFLPLLDDLELALTHLPIGLKANNWANGVKQVGGKVQRFLSSLGVKPIESVGLEFNPELHEAVELSDGDGDKEVVIEEMRKGYTINGEVIRPAMVRVGKEKK